MANSTTATSECSAVYGKRFLPAWIDKVGRETPEKVWAMMPRSTDLKDGFQEYHYSHLVAAIDTLAWWIESTIGRSTNFETVAYMGLSDMRYNIVPMALVKTGYKALFLSHRFSVAWHKDLMEQTGCQTLLFSEGVDSESITADSHIRAFQVAELDHLLSATGVRPFPYDKTFEEAKHDPIVISHTSGTTGMPKPIVWTHAIAATIDAHMIPSDLDGRKNVYATMKACKRQYSSMPMAHSPGLVRFLRAVFMDVTLVVGPHNRLIGPDTASLECVEEILKQTSPDAAYFLPSTLEALCESPQCMKSLSKLKLIGFGGGPLSKEAGDTIIENCPDAIIHNSLGSSDGGAFVTYEPDRQDWQYIIYCPHTNGISWRPTTTDGLYEMVIVRDPALELYQGAFIIHSNLHERSTRDLYSKHPSKPHHWRHEARVDDLIVAANGAKFNPLRLQSEVQMHPDVRFALMTGSHRHRPALIIQLREPDIDEERRGQIREEVWAIVSRMNAEFPIQGRVLESLVMFTLPGKDFPLAGKATVRRTAAIELYQSELDNLYDSAGPELVQGW